MDNIEENNFVPQRKKVGASLDKKPNQKKLLLYTISTIIKSILAGIMISMGGIAFLSIGNKYLGSALFTVAMFAICSYGLSSYTDKIGYAVVQNSWQNFQLMPTWIGNFCGAALSGSFLRMTDDSYKFSTKAAGLWEDNLSSSVLSVLIFSVFCGILIFIAVDNFKNRANGVGKYLGLVLASMVFILGGFEHCVLNMFYLSVAGAWSVKAILYIIIMTLGNSVGGMLIPVSYKLFEMLKNKID